MCRGQSLEFCARLSGGCDNVWRIGVMALRRVSGKDEQRIMMKMSSENGGSWFFILLHHPKTICPTIQAPHRGWL